MNRLPKLGQARWRDASIESLAVVLLSSAGAAATVVVAVAGFEFEVVDFVVAAAAVAVAESSFAGLRRPVASGSTEIPPANLDRWIRLWMLEEQHDHG